MSDTNLSEVEQKYFDTRGTAPLVEEAPPEADAPAGAADVVPKAAEVPAEDVSNVDEAKAEADNPGKFVRHGAFHEERQRRKEAEAKFEAFRLQEAANKARLEERLELIARSLQQPEPTPEPMDRLARLEQEWQQRTQAETEQRKQAEAQQRFYHTVTTEEHKFAQENPDYFEAINFAKQARLEDLKALGFEGPEAEAVLQNDVVNLTTDALHRGKSPAERFYNYAKARGWKKESAPAATPPANAEKIKTIAAGQAAGKSLGAVSGTSEAKLTLQALADMPQDEFDKIDAKTWRKMMGG